MHFVRVSAAPALIALAAFVTCVGGQNVAVAASAEKGKTAYIQHGCWQCHDYNGQGSIATSNGSVIARTERSLDAFKSFVRKINGPMPPYRPAVLSDDELDDIYAYLQSLPQPKAASTIPLLNAARSQ